MDTVTILRRLWRRRYQVLGVYVVALLAGTAVLYKFSPPLKLESRKYQVGIATTSILIDTPSSQVVEIAPKGSDTLGVRANLIASLMVDGVVKATIARDAGLNPNDLTGSSTSVATSAPAKPKTRNGPMLTTQVLTDNDGAELPIIQVDVQAADVTQAGRLAAAAVSGLRDYLDTKAAAQRIPNAQRLQVTGLGGTQAHDAARGPKSVFAVAAFLFVFGLGCAGILAVSGLIRGWKTAAAEEEARESDAAGTPRPSPAPAPVPAAAARAATAQAPAVRPAAVQPAPVKAVGDSWLSAPPRALSVARSPYDERDERQQRRARSA